MYVCVCQAVTDHQIYQAVENGVNTLRELRRDYRVGAECGRCADCARQCLKTAKENRAERQLLSAAA